MKSHYIHPESPAQLADYIDSLDNVVSITMTLNHLAKFMQSYDTGFNGVNRTYKGVPILVTVGDLETVVRIDCG